MTKTRYPWLRPTVDYGPLAAFFITYWLFGLMPATGAIIAATAVALALSLIVERRVPIMPLVTAAVVGVFGGLTLWFQDETFIKMKPTIIYLMFTAVLLGGLVSGRPLLKPLLGSSWRMDERGWSLLTLRFGLFFIVMAGLNELVWRTQTTDFWVSYKVFGTIVLMLAFTASQIPLMTRHQLPGEEEEDKPDDQ